MAEKGKCALCNQDIIWLRLDLSGVLIAVNYLPDPSGTLSIVDGKGHTNVGNLYDETLDLPRYKSHSLTCPSRNKKPKKEKQ